MITNKQWFDYLKVVKELSNNDNKDIKIYLYSENQITSLIACHDLKKQGKYPDVSIFEEKDFKRHWCGLCRCWTMYCPSCGLNMCSCGSTCPVCKKTWELDQKGINYTKWMKLYEWWDIQKWVFWTKKIIWWVPKVDYWYDKRNDSKFYRFIYRICVNIDSLLRWCERKI